jgi:hypothetical protein
VLASAQSYMKAFLSERVVNTLTKSSFSLTDIVEGKPLSIYIIIPPDKLRSHKALLRPTQSIVKRWIGDHKIRLQIWVGILKKRPLCIPANIRAINAPNRQVHPTQLIGRLVALLPIDRNIIQPPLVRLYKFLTRVQGATSAPKARCQKSFTCFAATPNTELIDNETGRGSKTCYQSYPVYGKKERSYR